MEAKARSHAVQDYLKTIYLLESAGEAAVSTSELAERLGVRAASVTGMLRHLAAEGLIDYAPYHGTRLTPDGRLLALSVVRRHRLLETLLVDDLGMSWDEVHAEAEVLEHSISDRVLELIATRLGDPVRDPHGDPIPSAELEIDEQIALALDRLPVGARGRLIRVLSSDPELLAYLDELGVTLGDEVEVLAREPFGGSLQVSFAGHEHRLGRLAAAALSVEAAR